MNKNIIIGLLAAAIIIGGGYYLFSQNQAGNEVPNVVNTENPIPAATNTNPTPNPVVLKPDAPTVETEQSSAVSSSTAVVNGKVKPNGASTSYWFEYGETTALGNRTIPQQIGSGYSLLPTPGYILGLKANTIYYFRLSANNSFATVNGNTIILKTNNTPPVVARAPTVNTKSASDLARTSANLNGTVNPNGFGSNYWFEYGKDINFGNVTTFQATNSGTAVMSVAASLANLEPLTKYYFRINAQNQYGTVNGTILNFTTTGPTVPTAPIVSTTSASNITTTGAVLNGRINPNGVETSYWFEYSQDSLLGIILGSGTSIQTLGAGSSNVNVTRSLTGLIRATKYYYRVVGRNSYGTVQGSIMSFRTKN